MANTAWNASDKSANITLTGSNLIATSTSTVNNLVRAVDKQITGKFYWEATCNTITGNSAVGFATSNVALGTGIAAINTFGGFCSVNRFGTIIADGAGGGSPLGTITSGMIICCAIDLTGRFVWFRVGAAGNWNGSASANPATGAGGTAFTNFGVGIPAFPAVTVGTLNDQVTANFGDTAFVGAVPSGFTSGFTAGVTSSTNAIATQSAVEHWLTVNAAAQVTQVALEHWATVAAAIPSVDPIKVMVLA